MRVDVDFSEETIKSCYFYKPHAFNLCQKQLRSVSNGSDHVIDENLAAESLRLAEFRLPYYRSARMILIIAY